MPGIGVKKGYLDGRQHHTLDMELFGPNAWLQGFYAGALSAAAEMAAVLADRSGGGIPGAGRQSERVPEQGTF